ncbi:cysteine desulfurase family protein [Estrella lausannensis]|uniref:Cysteine desulfurase n=1 Tax=Estrella lausannensis TaxID=483423 RepID=A0A0H5DNY4_9BACT|nr:cysteine desulfurase family protein [Estrella lausannensis]CRX38146.1 cysteine desulfurase [Estrella lausannensis]
MTAQKGIYLDNNASTEIDPAVKQAYFDAIEKSLGNPSSMHYAGQSQKKLLSEARYTIASYLGVKPTEIYFTSGATESVNMILRGIAEVHPGCHIVSSSVEHACVINTLSHLEKKGTQVTYIHPGLFGAATKEQVESALTKDTKLIALMAINNETGVKTDIEAIAELAKKRGIPFFVDGAALLGKERFSIPAGVTAMSFSGHKLHAPKGIGFSFVRKGLRFASQMTGGEQEFGKRGGTENTPAIVALAKAVQMLEPILEGAEMRMRELRDLFEVLLLQQLPNLSINGQGERVANTSNIAFPGIEGETLLSTLSLRGVAASHGSACASGALEPSRILLNMGIDPRLAASSLRFSLSRFTTREEIEAAAEIIVSSVKRP